MVSQIGGPRVFRPPGVFHKIWAGPQRLFSQEEKGQKKELALWGGPPAEDE